MRSVQIGIVLTILLVLAHAAWGFDVMILLGGGSNSSSDALKSALLAEPMIESATVVQAYGQPQSVEVLAGYDVVFANGIDGFMGTGEQGDHLADYIDLGGALVADANACIITVDTGLGGRLVSDDYLPVQCASETYGGEMYLGGCEDEHLIMSGVDTLHGKFGGVHYCGHSDESQWVAYWTGSEDLVYTWGPVVGINLDYDNYYVVDDAGQLASNAAVYAWTQTPPKAKLIDPDSAPNNGPIGVWITGGPFWEGGTEAWLVGPAKAEIPGQNLQVQPGWHDLLCDFDLTGAEPGLYDVVVVNPIGLGGMAGGFTVTEGTGDDDDDTGDDDSGDDDAGDDDDDDDDDDGGGCGCSMTDFGSD